MNLSARNIGFIGCAAAWGLAAGTGVYHITKNGKDMVKKGAEEKAICEQKIDSIKNVIRGEISEGENIIGKIASKCSNGSNPQKVINWQHALDSIRVGELGQKAIEEYNNAAATNVYKRVKSSAFKIIR